MLRERGDRLLAAPDLLERLDDAVVVDSQNRLDVEQRGRKAGGLPGAPTLDQVVEGVEQEVQAGLGSHLERASFDAGRIGSGCPCLQPPP